MARVVSGRAAYSLDDIVDIAVGVFLERGYDGASMDDIARAAGVSKAGLYHHVSGKEELLERGVNRALGALFPVLEEPGATSGAASARLRYILRRTVEIVCERTAEVSLLVRLSHTSTTHVAALERRREFDRAFLELAVRAKEDGELDASLDPQLLTRLAFGMAVALVDWYRPEGRYTPDQLADHVERLVFHGCIA